MLRCALDSPPGSLAGSLDAGGGCLKYKGKVKITGYSCL